MHDHEPAPGDDRCGSGRENAHGVHDHGVHDHGEPGDVVARAERLCRERGLQFTPLRRDVLAAVAAEPGPLGAYDIAERLSGPGRRVAAVSVYRALDFLTDQGLVHRIASRNAFVSCGHAHSDRAGLVFLICRTCGGIAEITAPALETELDRTLADVGFRPSGRILEVEGECCACARAA